MGNLKTVGISQIKAEAWFLDGKKSMANGITLMPMADIICIVEERIKSIKSRIYLMKMEYVKINKLTLANVVFYLWHG